MYIYIDNLLARHLHIESCYIGELVGRSVSLSDGQFEAEKLPDGCLVTRSVSGLSLSQTLSRSDGQLPHKSTSSYCMHLPKCYFKVLSTIGQLVRRPVSQKNTFLYMESLYVYMIYMLYIETENYCTR